MTKITLFDWQTEALKNWTKNNGKGVVESPTGAGKTYLGLKLIEKEKLSPFLIVVPTVELKQQWTNRIKKYYPDAIIKGIGGGEKYDGFTNTLNFSNRKIIVGIINSIRKKKFNVKTLIVDEVHHSTILAPINYGIWNNIKAKYILGLSASPIPERLGSEDTGWNIPRVFKYTLQEAYEDKVLLKPKIESVGVQLEEREQKEYNELTKKIKSKSGSFGSFSNAPVWFKQWTFERNEILFGSNRKMDSVIDILTRNNFKKAIIFTERIETAQKISREIGGMGIFEEYCLHSGVNKKMRREAVNRFVETSLPCIITTAHLFEEGMDVPDVDLIILHSFNNTKRESLQRIGRSLHNHSTVPKVYILHYEDTKENYAMKKIKELFE